MRRLGRLLFLLAATGLVIFLFARSIVVVDETEYVIITEFGRPVIIYGSQEGDSGFHFKWPWRSVRPVDRRLRVFDPPTRELITSDKRNLEVSSYVVWRVVDPDRFVRSAGTLETAEERLSERVSAALSHLMGTRELASIASTDRKVWALDTLTSELVKTLAPPAKDELGIELVDVRLRRFNFPVEVRPAVFDLIRSERKQVAAVLRADGDAQYQVLISQADRERDGILAKAEADAERIKGQGEAEAMRVLNEAHGRDPKFYEFLRTLETYRSILDDRATVILSSASPLLKLLIQGPGEDLLRDTPPVPPAPEASSGEKIAAPGEKK